MSSLIHFTPKNARRATTACRATTARCATIARRATTVCVARTCLCGSHYLSLINRIQ